MIENKKCISLIFCLFCLLGLKAQDDARYLAGAVPEVDGKVVFTKTIDVLGNPSAAQIYSLMKNWVDKEYLVKAEGLQNRILLDNPQSYDIACLGEEYLTFKKSGFVLDRAKIVYQFIIQTENGKCNLTIRNIKYEYQENKKPLTAEEMISDKEALNKSQTKLNRENDKFRIHTLDMVDRIFGGIEVYLNGKVTTGAAMDITTAGASVSTPPIRTVSDPVQSFPPLVDDRDAEIVAGMSGFKRIMANKLPGNIIKYLNDNGALLINGTPDQASGVTTSWGGVGVLWDKPVAFCFTAPNNQSAQLMDSGDMYTISFYTDAYNNILTAFAQPQYLMSDNLSSLDLTLMETPSGATVLGEAWLVIECRKLAVDQIVPNIGQASTNKSDEVKMYIGEIVSIWIK